MQHYLEDQEEEEEDDSKLKTNNRPEKKRRVTKACDQCRRRRVKCEADSNPASTSCLVCIEAGTPQLCTFSRPSKKRGPQAGHAKSLTERVNSLERLVGHLVLVNAPVLDSLSASFFNPSPSSPSPAVQLSAFNSSPFPALLDALPPVATTATSTTGPTTATASNSKARARSESSAEDSSNRFAIDPGPAWASEHESTSTAGSTSTPLSLAQRKVLGLWTPQQPAQDGLHALASAAMGSGMEVEPSFGTSPASSSSNYNITPFQAAMPNIISLSIPTLPSEAIRNQLVDLYFNQVVHPTYPILDKAQFFRWSAHAHLSPALSPPPELYLAVFAISVPYLSPTSQRQTHTAEVFASSARKWLWDGIKEPNLERVQAAALLALVDWGRGEMARAWNLSALALSSALSLSLHISDSTFPSTPNNLKTFHAVLMIHTLLALRLSLPPLILHSDYSVPLPPSDGPENFELWRSDKSPEELRGEYGNSSFGGGGGERGERGGEYGRTHAVRLSAGATFSKMAELCAIGVGICGGRRGDRREVGRRLAEWEKGLPTELKLGEGGGTEWLGERSRVVVEMHALKATLGVALGVDSPYSITPAHHVSQLGDIISCYSSQYTFYRSLPNFELFLHSLWENAGTYEIVNRGLAEFGRVWPVGNVGRREERKPGNASFLGVNSAIMDFHHTTPLSHLLPLPSAVSQIQTQSLPIPPTLPVSQQATPAYPSYLPEARESTSYLPEPHESSYLPDPNNPGGDTISFTQWDQSDLLVSLGLVIDPSQGWREEGEGLVGTDLLTRWLDRGTVGWDV